MPLGSSGSTDGFFHTNRSVCKQLSKATSCRTQNLIYNGDQSRMAKYKLQYPVSVCYHKRWFVVGDALCVPSPQIGDCCVRASMGYARNLANAICFTVVGFLEPVLHWSRIFSRFLGCQIFFKSGRQKPKLNGENQCSPLTVSA